MDERCEKIFATIKKMRKVRWKDLIKKLVPKEMSKPTLDKHLNEHLYNEKVEKIKDDTNPFIEYYIVKKPTKFIKPAVKKKLTVEICRHGIVNRGFDINNPINSEVEILLRIANPTKNRIGISKILVESRDKDYPIAVDMQIVEENEYKWINSVILEPEETKLIRLVETTRPISLEKKYIEANVQIFDTKSKIMKKIPIKLYIGYMIITE